MKSITEIFPAEQKEPASPPAPGPELIKGTRRDPKTGQLVHIETEPVKEPRS